MIITIPNLSSGGVEGTNAALVQFTAIVDKLLGRRTDVLYRPIAAVPPTPALVDSVIVLVGSVAVRYLGPFVETSFLAAYPAAVSVRGLNGEAAEVSG